MGTCMSKKKMSSSAAKSVSTSTPQLQPQTVTVFNSKVESERLVSQKENKQKDEQSQVKKEVFIIKHRKSNDGGASGREKISKHACSDGVSSIPMTNYVAAEAKVDEILLECGRLSRNSSGKVVSSGERGRGRKHSGSKRSQDFDHCENDTTTIAIGNNDLFCEDDDGLAGENQPRLRQHRNRRRSPVPSSERRRRTPSRERDQQQRSSSRERRCSRSPSKRSSDTTTCNLTNNTTTRPGKMFSVPATVSSLSMDKSYNGDGATVRVIAKRNVGSASPRSQSPSRANGNKVTLLSENQQQQPSMSRNSSRKAEQSPHRRNPLSEIDVNSLAYTQSVNNNSSRFQSRPKREIESHANQRIKADTNSNTESRRSSMKTKEQQEEEEVKGQSSMTENVNLKTTIIPPSGLDNFKPQASTLTRSRSSRRSRDLDYLLLNPETIAIPAQSYTSLLLEDIQNFHQMNNNNITPSVTLPACVAKACSILEAVADLNSSTRSNLSANHYAKRVPDSSIKEHPFVESEVNVIDDVMEPSLHKYVTVSRDGSLLGGVIDMEGQESSACNNFTVSGQRHVGFSSSSSSSSSVKPNSGNPTDSWNPSKRREFDFQRIRSGRFSDIKDVHAIPIVVTTAEST